MPRVTITDVAEACGVSPMTASRALRGGEHVKESTRLKVLAAAETLGYHRNARLGRPHKGSRRVARGVDVIFSMKGHPPGMFYAELLNAIERELARRGHYCVYRTATGEYENFVSLCDTLRESDSVGTLLVGFFDVEQLRSLLSIDGSAILVDNPGDPSLAAPYESIGFDDREAARTAVRHLCETGRKRIALVKGFSDHYFSRAMEEGYIDALGAAGIAVDRSLVLEADFTAQGAYELISSFLKGRKMIDAVFTNDEMACGVLRALHEREVAVPDSVAVVGCDGLPIGQQTMPPLTTVKLDYVQLGRTAVDHLLDRKAGTASPRRVRLLPELVVRESTAVRGGRS